MSVILETTLGDITVDLYTKERPRTCLNFLKLCKVKYYNFCLIHSVQRNFMIQTGDPTGTGRSGESIFAKIYGEQAQFFEPEKLPKLKHTKLGIVSMVNNGNNHHGSQFFITTAENLDYLDGIHTVFGEVAEGFEVLMKISDTLCDEQHRPYKDIRINHSIILDDPFDDPQELEIPPCSPEPSEEVLKSDRIGAYEEIDDDKGKTLEEIEEEIQEKEAKARVTILEMVGDIPDADMKPPENVLFVCKLNPVTTDEDLEIIFSRFGKINSCEIIRDKKTGDSLQYAFIEFDKEEDCENAYFKMDNVLIDDRRIHVDFSQSVAKLIWKGKGKGVEDLRTAEDKKQFKFTFKNKPRSQGDYDLVFDDNEVARNSKERQKDKSPHLEMHKKKKESSPNESSEKDHHHHHHHHRHKGGTKRKDHSDQEHKRKHKKHKHKEKKGKKHNRKSHS